MLFKFIPPETLERFGSADSFADAVDASVTKLATIVGDRDEVRALLLGSGR
jgi:hypothetical protein